MKTAEERAKEWAEKIVTVRSSGLRDCFDVFVGIKPYDYQTSRMIADRTALEIRGMIEPYLRDMLEEHTRELSQFGMQECPMTDDTIQEIKDFWRGLNPESKIKDIKLIEIIEHQRARIAVLEGILSDAGKDSDNFRAYSLVTRSLVRAVQIMGDKTKDLTKLEEVTKSYVDAYGVLIDTMTELAGMDAPDPGTIERATTSPQE